MKKASKIMYLLGKIFTIIGLVGDALGIAFGGISIAHNEEIFQKLVESGTQGDIQNAAQVKELGLTIIVACIFSIILAVVILALIENARKAVYENRPAKKLHIWLIVLGALNSLFILLGGAFALAALSEEQPNAEPEKKE